MPDKKKPSVDLSRALVPLAHFTPDEVPKSGHQELIAFARGRERRLWNLAGGAAASAASALLAWLLYTSFIPFIWSFFAAGSVMAALWAFREFLRLAFGRKAYQALPEHATEAAARLEGATRLALFPWNGDASVWNDEARRWNGKAAAWDRLKPGDVVDGVEMTPELLVLEGRLLLEEKHRLLLERETLVRRRQEIEAAIDELSIPRRLAASSEGPKMLVLPQGTPPKDPSKK